MKLADMTCGTPKAGEPPCSPARALELLAQLHGWALAKGSIVKEFHLGSFGEAMSFVNSVAAVAEREGHHPDIFVSYKLVRLTLSTHKIGGLSINDFILAAKLDMLPASRVAL